MVEFSDLYIRNKAGIGVNPAGTPETPPTTEKLEVKDGKVKADGFVGKGSEITDLNGENITTGIIDDARIPETITRESRFDPTTGHNHTGTQGDGPRISHSNLDDILQVDPSSNDNDLTKHVSDELAKGWQDHINMTSGNPHGTTAMSVGALPIGGGTITGDLQVNGSAHFGTNLLIKMAGGRFASLTNNTFSNENVFQKDNLKLSLGSRPFVSFGQPFTYDFVIGHTEISRTGSGLHELFATNFVKKFSINQKGNLYCAGSKAGYVIDYFINSVGDTLEQGEVVVLSKYQVSQYSGTDNNIPIPEVDLTDKAYDTRVCGIVTEVVTEKDLPHVETGNETITINEVMTKDRQEENQFIHPLYKYAARISEELDPKKIEDQQMGKMVTLGAFAHCKVDADIAPIEVGDLLTTSTTKGHAQKVVDREKAIGSIIGKALRSLEKGRGKIPIMVMLQ